MDITLNPEARKFVDDQVKTGRFPSPDAVLGEALNRMMSDMGTEIDDDTAAAINRGEAQLDAGQGIDFDQFAADFRKRLSGR